MGMGGDGVRHRRKVCFSGKKMGVPLIIFFKKLGVPPNHQIFRLRPSGALIRGKPIFFPKKKKSVAKVRKNEKNADPRGVARGGMGFAGNL